MARMLITDLAGFESLKLVSFLGVNLTGKLAGTRSSALCCPARIECVGSRVLIKIEDSNAVS